MVNTGKKLLNIAFQYPAGLGVVLADLISEALEAVHRLMNAFFVSARERLASERLVEKRIEQSINRMVKHSVPYSRLMDLAGLRVRNGKHMIAAVLVSMFSQIFVEVNNIIQKMERELLDVSLLRLAQDKLPPSGKQIF
jgi:tRNA(Glu) U13 pseudouridine synthase TruD